MSDPDDARGLPGFDRSVGLCSVCVHAREVKHPRGGTSYRMCRLSETDERFRKFPPLPVSMCPGFTTPDER